MPHSDFTRLHFKILSEPNISAEIMLQRAIEVFDTASLDVELGSTEPLLLNITEPIDTGNGDPKLIKSEVILELVDHRHNVGSHDVAVYFVEDLDQGSGFTFPQVHQTSVLIERFAGLWSLAHEVGHALGLEHSSNPQNLMFGNGSGNNTSPPILISGQIEQLRQSALVQHR